MRNRSPVATTLYRYYDEQDKLLYVGITKRPRRRTKEHSAFSKWFTQAKKCTFEHFESRREALSAEFKAIKKEKPKSNITHNHENWRELDKQKVKISSSLNDVEDSKLYVTGRVVCTNPLMDPGSAARILDVSKAIVRSAIDSGQLKTTTVYYKWREKTMSREYITGWDLLNYVDDLRNSEERS